MIVLAALDHQNGQPRVCIGEPRRYNTPSGPAYWRQGCYYGKVIPYMLLRNTNLLQ